MGLGELGGDRGQRRGPGEARDDDGRKALLGELADGLLALGVARNLEVAVIAAGFLLVLLGAIIGSLVEGFVELAATVIDQRRISKRRASDKSCRSDTGSQSPEVPSEVGHELSPCSRKRAAVPHRTFSRVGEDKILQSARRQEAKTGAIPNF